MTTKADGTHLYLYGQGRIAQYAGTDVQYFLADGLGSVRQLTNAAGAVTLARAYEPYGETLSSSGASATSYGFTGEWTTTVADTALLYLRARWYAPTQARFLSKDAWPGDYNRPLSLNNWLYVGGNPVTFADPSGRCAPFCIIAGGAIFILVAILLSSCAPVDVDEQLHINQRSETITWEYLLQQPEARKTVVPPFPVQWPTAERRHDVLVVGEGDYSYSRSLIARHADWYITTSDYGDGSNNQEIVGTYNNAIKVANVDATRLGIGAITGSNKYDVIIFNAPRATEGPFFSASGDLVERVLLSAQDVLKPGGQVRFSGTKAYPASPRLEQLILRIPSGYSQASKVPFLSDANYGIPYNALTLDGKSLNPNFREWNWYIFIK